MAIYFGGSRHFAQVSSPLSSVVSAVVAAGHLVHVGCQRGADQAVVQSCTPVSSLVVFAVAPFSSVPWHVKVARGLGALVHHSAGGSNAPIQACYLLRSIAAFQGCQSAVFFQPGAGSLAVAREALKAGLPVFAFGSMPARVPSSAGQWVESSFFGFSCWQWSAPKQISLF